MAGEVPALEICKHKLGFSEDSIVELARLQQIELYLMTHTGKLMIYGREITNAVASSSPRNPQMTSTSSHSIPCG